MRDLEGESSVKASLEAAKHQSDEHCTDAPSSSSGSLSSAPVVEAAAVLCALFRWFCLQVVEVCSVASRILADASSGRAGASETGAIATSKPAAETLAATPQVAAETPMHWFALPFLCAEVLLLPKSLLQLLSNAAEALPPLLPPQTQETQPPRSRISQLADLSRHEKLQGVPPAECGEWVAIFCCSLLTRAGALPFIRLLDYVEHDASGFLRASVGGVCRELTADVLELFCLALLSPSEAKRVPQQQQLPSSDRCRFSFLLQRLQHKFASASREALWRFLLGLGESVVREECSKSGSFSTIMQAVGTSAPFVRFLREQLAATMLRIDNLQQAKRLYFSAVAPTTQTASEASGEAAVPPLPGSENERFIRFLCAIKQHTNQLETTQAGKKHRQQQDEILHAHDQQQQQHHHLFDLLRFSLPQNFSPSDVGTLLARAESMPVSASRSNSGSGNCSVTMGCSGKPSWLCVSDSFDLLESLLVNVAEATHVCSSTQWLPEAGAREEGGDSPGELDREQCMLVQTLVRLLVVYQQQRVLAVLATQQKRTPGEPPRELPDEEPTPQPGDRDVWQLMKWSINTAPLLRALALFSASSESVKQAALEANGEGLLLADQLLRGEFTATPATRATDTPALMSNVCALTRSTILGGLARLPLYASQPSMFLNCLSTAARGKSAETTGKPLAPDNRSLPLPVHLNPGTRHECSYVALPAGKRNAEDGTAAAKAASRICQMAAVPRIQALKLANMWIGNELFSSRTWKTRRLKGTGTNEGKRQEFETPSLSL
ncbi:uncharacterized protein LOC34619647 [Cyclospora cayetanensis]|uniref:Uncharacterized protein LOC34619647 n=1 Tax=Cyclospora cayetanensis TaxID=88456 RepID=A0A6P6S5H0_9EIME|nr:uncharacterized protein LOC34619647 [Cyclospora cayetanensis]